MQFTGNFGAARSQGLELELTTRPLDNLDITFNIGYTDAEFTEAVPGGINPGDSLQFVPEWTGALNADYVFQDAIEGYDFFLRTDISYVGESLSRVNTEPRIRDSYEQVNLRLGLRNDKYTATIFVRNLTDKIANLADNRSLAAEVPGRPRFVVSRPRTIGVEFSANF